MIDLSQTRAGLLAAIGALDRIGEPLTDITAHRVATDDVSVRLHGHTRDELFPRLKLALEERYAAVPRHDLIRDLLMPLRNGLSNACKHGIGADPSRTVTVELTLTAWGALVAVSDEGRGFDVADTLRRFLEHERYVVGQGVGFRNLHQAQAVVSYENGGRTLLLCYRPPPALPQPLSSRVALVDAAVFDSEWIANCLGTDLPELADGGIKLETCRVYATAPYAGRKSGDVENRYVLRLRPLAEGLTQTRILTGRVYTTARAAAADVAAANALRTAQISKTVLIPRPVARSVQKPRLVFYEFDPWLNLRDYVSYQGNLAALEHCGASIGRALARWHRSRSDLSGSEVKPVGNVSRFGWDSIHYGVDGRFYLYPFAWCRRPDPRRELAGYVTDLMQFALAHHDEGVYRRCRAVLLDGYNSKAEHPLTDSDLRPIAAK